jgi:hypothetical protein
MNKYKLLVAVAVAGLFGLSARASISGFDSVNIKCTILMQTNDTYPNANTTKFNVTKMKVTNKDILNLIAPEFATNSPSPYTNFPFSPPALNGFPPGSKLVVDNFFDGEFYVVSGTNVILHVQTGPEDLFVLYLEYSNNVYTGSDTASKETKNYTTIGEFKYVDGTDANNFDVYGLTTVKDTFKASGESESFKMTGLAGDGSFGGTNAVVSGTVKGSGKNNMY